jgi:hypothetical protein
MDSVTQPLQAQFIPAAAQYSECAPTWNDTDGMSPGPAYRHRIIQGQVSDGNSYALGGIAGHAGLFAPVAAVMKLARSLLFPNKGGTVLGFLNRGFVCWRMVLLDPPPAVGLEAAIVQSNHVRCRGISLSLTVATINSCHTPLQAPLPS